MAIRYKTQNSLQLLSVLDITSRHIYDRNQENGMGLPCSRHTAALFHVGFLFLDGGGSLLALSMPCEGHWDIHSEFSAEGNGICLG